MIDFIRIDVTEQLTRKDLEEMFELEFVRETRFRGRLKVIWQGAELDGLRIWITDDQRTWIEGSLHKWWTNYTNGAPLNFDRFDRLSGIAAIERLCTYFSLNPYKTDVLQMEYGVNLEVDLDVEEVINRALISYRGHPYASSFIQPGLPGCLREFAFEDYYVKIYNKGLQYRLQWEVLRFEIKARKRRALQKIGVRTLADLQLKETWIKMADDLYKKFTINVLMIDPIHFSKPIPGISSELGRLSNPNYWKAIHGAENRKLREREKKNLASIDASIPGGIHKYKKHITDVLKDELNAICFAPPRDPKVTALGLGRIPTIL